MSASPSTPDSAGAEPWVGITASGGLPAWLAEQRVSLAFTTYQSAKLFLIGRGPDVRLSAFERTFDRCMGLCASSATLWLSTRFQLWRLENALQPGHVYQGYDRLYVPRVGYTTGDLDGHDVAVEASGRVVFVATRLNCLAAPSERVNFTPLWRPPFISGLVAEDRCHLNGLAVDGGQVRYVTAVAATDTADAWRERRRDGGCVLEVPSGRVVASGLSMPHSPRVNGGRLWLLESGTGHLGSIDPATSVFERLTFCPGYLRGLAFTGDFAVVGLSRPRHDRTFTGLALDDELTRRGEEAVCGLDVIDLRTGEVAHWLRLADPVRELYDVAVLPGVVRPMALGFKTDEIERLVVAGEEATI